MVLSVGGGASLGDGDGAARHPWPAFPGLRWRRAVRYHAVVQRIFILLVLLGSLFGGREARAADGPPAGRVVKVLPFMLNRKGHDSLAPSLFERNSYQAYLREHTNEISTLRYDVLWKASGKSVTKVTVRVELRAIAPNGDPVFKTLEATVKPGYFRRWISFELSPADYHKLGAVVAWRASVWWGDLLLDEQRSFLW